MHWSFGVAVELIVGTALGALLSWLTSPLWSAKATVHPRHRSQSHSFIWNDFLYVLRGSSECLSHFFPCNKTQQFERINKRYVNKKCLSCSIKYIYIYIYAPPWGLSSLAKELSATVSVMQGSSKELSSLVAGRVCKNVNKGCCCLLNIKYLKIPLANVVRL